MCRECMKCDVYRWISDELCVEIKKKMDLPCSLATWLFVQGSPRDPEPRWGQTNRVTASDLYAWSKATCVDESTFITISQRPALTNSLLHRSSETSL